MIESSDNVSNPIADIYNGTYSQKPILNAIAEPDMNSKLSWICGLLSVILIYAPLIPLILSIIAINKSKKYRYEHYGKDCKQSKWGGILGKIYLGLWFAAMAFYIVTIFIVSFN